MRKGRSLTVFAAWILALVMAVCILPASAENVSAEPPASTAAVESDTAGYEQNAGSTADSDSYAGVPSDYADDRYAYPDTHEIPDDSSDYPEFCDDDDDPSVSLYASGVTVGPTRFTLVSELDEIRLQIEYAENANRFRIYRRAAGETKFVRIDTIDFTEGFQNRQASILNSSICRIRICWIRLINLRFKSAILSL